MVDGVAESLFDGRHREVPEPLGFGLVGVLDDRLLQVVALDIPRRIAQYRRQRPTKLLLFEIVAAWAVRKPDHIDLRRREVLVRVVVEEQQANVLGEEGFRGASDDVHASSENLHRKFGYFLQEVAADILQVLLNQPQREVV